MRLALLPGLDGTGRLFEPLIPALPAKLDPLIVPYPPSCAGSIADHVDVAAEALSGGGQWLLLAESFSGPVAARLLVDRPELEFLGAVFCASFISCPRAALLRLLRTMPLRSMFAFPPPDWLVRTFCLGPRADRNQIAELRLALSQTGPAALATRMRTLADLPAFERTITSPCLYIRPSGDRLVPWSCVQEIGRRCRQLQVVHIDGPHFVLQAAPGPCADAIASFAEHLLRSDGRPDPA